MEPLETAAAYDRIAHCWHERMQGSDYGRAALERAVRHCPDRGPALDVGCGDGRLIAALAAHGFRPEGLDLSRKMLALARAAHPGVAFHEADIAVWQMPRRYDLVIAWDSTFHLPPDRQAPVLEKLCAGLASGGVLLFTCGGDLGPREVSGSFDGERFHYSTLGVTRTISLLDARGCAVRHVEYDQYPENHVVVIARRA